MKIKEYQMNQKPNLSNDKKKRKQIVQINNLNNKKEKQDLAIKHIH